MDKVTRGWRTLHNEEFYGLYSSPDFILLIKSLRMKCAGHVVRMGIEKVRVWFWLVYLSERHHLEILGFGGKILLKRIFEMWNVQA